MYCWTTSHQTKQYRINWIRIKKTTFKPQITRLCCLGLTLLFFHCIFLTTSLTLLTINCFFFINLVATAEHAMHIHSPLHWMLLCCTFRMWVSQQVVLVFVLTLHGMFISVRTMSTHQCWPHFESVRTSVTWGLVSYQAGDGKDRIHTE